MSVAKVCAGLAILVGGVAPPPAPGYSSPRPPTRIDSALRIASATWRVPYHELRSVAWCESRYRARADNPRSDAAGLLQIMAPGTWSTTPYRGFSPYSPEANALAAAWIVRKDGSWRQWAAECRP